jgi:hypothetical protein
VTLLAFIGAWDSVLMRHARPLTVYAICGSFTSELFTEMHIPEYCAESIRHKYLWYNVLFHNSQARVSRIQAVWNVPLSDFFTVLTKTP